MKKVTLNSREKLFVHTFLETKDAIKSYREHYNCDGLSETMIGFNVQTILNDPKVKSYFQELRTFYNANLLFDSNDVMNEWAQTYLADINEIVSVHTGACRYCHGLNHEYQWTQNEYLDACREVTAFNDKMPDERLRKSTPEIKGGLGYNKTLPPHPNCPECNGTGHTYSILKDTETLSPQAKRLYRGVKMTKYGPEVILADKDKALENIAKALSMFQEKFVVVTPNDAKIDGQTITKENAMNVYQSMAQIVKPTSH